MHPTYLAWLIDDFYTDDNDKNADLLIYFASHIINEAFANEYIIIINIYFDVI
jgi:hypothetical protein